MKKLYRSNRNRVFSGVAGGLAEYFNIDPVIMRAIFIALCFAGSLGFWLYVILWIVLPSNPKPYPSEDNIVDAEIIDDDEKKNEQSKTQLFLGVLLIGLGIVFFFVRAFPDFMHFIWPIVLILIGVLLMSYSFKNKKQS